MYYCEHNQKVKMLEAWEQGYLLYYIFKTDSYILVRDLISCIIWEHSSMFISNVTSHQS